MYLSHVVSLPAKILEAPLVCPTAVLLLRSLMPLTVAACAHVRSVSLAGPWMSVLEVLMLVLMH